MTSKAYRDRFKAIDWSDLDQLPSRPRERPRGPRSAIPCPMLIRDELPELRGMHNGRIYTSKAALRRSYKAHGLEEMGNDAPVLQNQPKAKVTRDEVAQALAKVKEGYKPNEEVVRAPPSTTGFHNALALPEGD